MFTYALNSLSLFSVNKRVLVIVFTAVLLTIALMAISGTVFAGPATSPSACGMLLRLTPDR
ncbi:MAG: hypothetical protein HND48_15905 [Chloroflexi bacterium]|nr:hypothetical protein [Chloroflexota bacterium]